MHHPEFIPSLGSTRRTFTRLMTYAAAAVLVAFVFGTCSAQAALNVEVTSLKGYDPSPRVIQPPYFDVRITGDAANDKVSLSLSGQLLKVNGQNPAGMLTDLAHVVRLRVDGGPGNDTINLRGLRGFGGFINRELGLHGAAAVMGGPGDDRILGLGTTAADIAALVADSPPRAARQFGWKSGNVFSLAGGAGDDLLVGSHGADAIFGGAGSDQIRGLSRPDRLHGGSGPDRIWGGDNAGNRDEISGGAGNDILFGGPGPDILEGKRGNDRLIGGPGRDVMYQNTKSRRWPGGCDEAPPGLCWPIIG